MEQQRGPEPSDRVSLVERLREQFGSEIDPGISLEPSTKLPEVALGVSGDALPSSGVLSRLESRGSLATRYRLDGEIARGGMGAILEVWDEDLRRHLAMKVALSSEGEGSLSKPENLDARVLARFLEEAQVTGQLDHPGIVPVHELGLDQNGNLYFTMPLVRGRDLEAIFALVAKDEEGWSTTRALGVLLKACEAMAYAHDKGVIHRDLKPANVMVGRFGEVYVMDWGLARVRGHEDRHDCRIARAEGESAAPDENLVAIDPRADATGESNAALYTMDGDVIGTPAYMALEQARGELDSLDKRTDVYSLGAMLYRLLTGTTPYVPLDEGRNALEILTELLLGPPRPIEELSPETPLELVAVCEKAMARAPGERYADMSEFAEDLRAFLENRVVRAYETGAVAEARKWVRRNKPLALSLAAGLLALIGGMVASVVLKGRADENAFLAEERRIVADASARVAKEQRALADEQRELAEEQRIVAETEREKADANAQLAEQSRVAAEESATLARRQAKVNQEVNSFMNEALFSPASVIGFDRNVRVRDVLGRAAIALELRFQEEPVIEAELRLTLARSFESLGEYKQSLVLAQRALDLITPLKEEHVDFYLRINSAVGDAYLGVGEARKSAEIFEESLAFSIEKFGELHKSATTTMNNLALAYTDLSEFQKARDLYERSLRLSPPSSRMGDDDIGATLGNYGELLNSMGELEAAEEWMNEAIDLRKRRFGRKDPLMIDFKNNLAVLYSDQGRLRESGKLQREVLKAQESVHGHDHPDTGRTMSSLAVLYLKQGRYAKAEKLLVEAAIIVEAALGEDHEETLRVRHNLASCYSYQDRLEEALEISLPTTEALKRVAGPRDATTLDSMNNLAVLYLNLGRYVEAEELYRETLELQTEVLGPDHPTTLITLENLGGVLYQTERYEESKEIVFRVLEGRKRVLGPNHPDVAKTNYNLAMNAISTGNPNGAIELLESALVIYRAVGEDHINMADCLAKLGEIRMDLKDYEGAALDYAGAVDLRKKLGLDDAVLSFWLHQQGYAVYATDNAEKAVPIFREAFELRVQFFGEAHVNTLTTEYMLAMVLHRAGRDEEAEPLAIDFYERTLAAKGPDDPKVAVGLELLKKIAAE